jgi:phosphodiesterase/alkaline phosphatase D-like protein
MKRLILFLLAFVVASFGERPPNSDARLLAGPIVQTPTDTSAAVFWISDRELNPRFKYGTDRNHLEQTAQPQNPNPNAPGHFREYSTELSNLQPNKTYYFEIVGADGQVHGRGSFQTEPDGYAKNNPTRITHGPVIEYLSSTSAEIAWSTNVSSSTLVRYGEDANALTKTAQAPWGQETHRVVLKGLKPNTTYYFVVESGEAKDYGTMAKSSEAQLTTPQDGEQALTNIVPKQ